MDADGGIGDVLAAGAGDGRLDGAAGHDGRHGAAVVGRAADVGDRRCRGGRGAGGGRGGAAAAVACRRAPAPPPRDADGSSGASAVIAILRLAIPSPSSVTTRGRADDGDLHRAAVLEPHVGAAGARAPACRQRRPPRAARPAPRSVLPGPGEELGQRRRSRAPLGPCSDSTDGAEARAAARRCPSPATRS